MEAEREREIHRERERKRVSECERESESEIASLSFAGKKISSFFLKIVFILIFVTWDLSPECIEIREKAVPLLLRSKSSFRINYGQGKKSIKREEESKHFGFHWQQLRLKSRKTRWIRVRDHANTEKRNKAKTEKDFRAQWCCRWLSGSRPRDHRFDSCFLLFIFRWLTKSLVDPGVLGSIPVTWDAWF